MQMTSKKFIIGQVDPTQHLDQPLWCIYGYACFPQVICCKVNMAGGAPTIWGYSVWNGEPGFRTLGLDVSAFSNRHEMVRFFADKDIAMKYLTRIITPRKMND
jgi:hypothetical protein